MKVKFENVGRNKKSWEAETNTTVLTYDFLYCQAKKAITSSDIEFGLDKDDIHKGVIFVGGFREVGRFEVLDKEFSYEK